MIQEGMLNFDCATGLKRGRFVTITEATGTVAYTAAAAAANAITVTSEDNLQISVRLLKRMEGSFWFTPEGTIAKGADVEVGTDGQGVTYSAGAVVCVNKEAVVASTTDDATGYNID